MDMGEWMRLFKAIDWNNPYVSLSTVKGRTPKERSKSKTEILRVEYPDGRVVQCQKAVDTFIEVIENNYPDLIHELNILHSNVNLVTKERSQQYTSAQREIADGWLVFTNINTRRKREDLIKISNELELDLKVDIVSVATDEIINLEDAPSTSTRQKIKVTFPNGRTIQPNKVLETLVEVVKYAGANAVRDLNINICGTNMIVEEDEINSKYEVATKFVGEGLYANTISSTQKKYQIIKQISDDLGLDLKVEYVSINNGNSEPVTYPVTGSTRQKIKVTFPDGKIIQHNVVLDTLIEVIRYAKPEMVRKLKIINCADNLILKYHEINPRYIKPTKQLDDTFYVNTCSDTNTKYMQIKEISDRLHLNLIVELV